MNPFDVLLPELWVLVRGHLHSQWGCWDRVALQRTCKEAHRLDPGLILPKAWENLLKHIEDNAPNKPTQWQRCLDVLVLFETFVKSRVWNQECHKLPFDVYESEPTTNRWTVCLRWWSGLGVEIRLFYERTASCPWQLEVEVEAVDGDSTAEMVVIKKKTLDEILQVAPTLGQGVHPEMMRLWAARGMLRRLVCRE